MDLYYEEEPGEKTANNRVHQDPGEKAANNRDQDVLGDAQGQGQKTFKKKGNGDQHDVFVVRGREIASIYQRNLSDLYGKASIDARRDDEKVL
jgi:hypothetical protein